MNNLKKYWMAVLLSALSIAVCGQARQISGVVLESTESGAAPVAGAGVMIAGTSKGTITDGEGRFVISAAMGDLLEVSFLGYKKKQVPVGKGSYYEIYIESESLMLDQLVVVGYGTMKKSDLATSITSVNTKDMKIFPASSAAEMLRGRAAGVTVTSASGRPGSVPSIQIRGTRSISASNTPLYIIDGSVASDTEFAMMNADDIESIEILKDAASQAIYGARASDGVILVTTKRGKAGESTVTYNGYVGVQTLHRNFDLYNADEYIALRREAVAHDMGLIDATSVPIATALGDEVMAEVYKSGKYVDWEELMFKKAALYHSHELSFRGGTDKVRYYVLANFFSQGGNYKYSDAGPYNSQSRFTRYNFRSNVDIDISKWLTARLDIGARITNRNAPGTTADRLMTICATQPPYLPILVEENSHPQNEEYIRQNPLGMLYGDNVYRFNILGELSRTGYLNEKNTYLNGSFSMNLDMGFLTEGLSADVMFSYDASEGRWINRKLDTYKDGYREYPMYATFMPVNGSDVYMNGGHYTGAYKTGNKYEIDQTLGNGFSHNASDGRTYFQVRLDYHRVFNERHEVTAMLLANRSNRTVNNEIAYHSQGLTGRLAYYYGGKYLLEFNFGYNGSENFAPGKRYGFFPAGSIGWVISDEDFVRYNASWINFLKVRVSYGLVGSDAVSSRFPYLAFYGSGDGYDFGNNFGTNIGGTSEGNLANENLTWEKARKLNVGLDFTTLGERLALNVDFFHEYRYDIITDMTSEGIMGYPDVVGKDAALQNLGIVTNRGVDVELSWSDRIGKDFRYYIRPNLTFARNRLEYKAEVARNNPWRQETGKRLYENFVYVFDHFVADQAEADRLNEIGYQPWGTLIPGDVVYKDLDRNGVIDDEDRAAMGNPRSPEIMFGIPVGFQWKNLDFSILLQGATCTSILLNGAAVYDFPQFDQDKIGKVKVMHLQRWTPETASTAKYPALHYGTHDNNKNSNSSLFLYDASYLRLKNVEIGYSLPQKWMQKMKMQQARIYFQALNLLTFDKLEDVDIDPETKSGDGASWYPIQKVFNFGIDITF